jgi:hypothetical protein
LEIKAENTIEAVISVRATLHIRERQCNEFVAAIPDTLPPLLKKVIDPETGIQEFTDSLKTEVFGLQNKPQHLYR